MSVNVCHRSPPRFLIQTVIYSPLTHTGKRCQESRVGVRYDICYSPPHEFCTDIMATLKDNLSIQLQDVSKRYGTRTLFETLSLQIGARSRIGLIGRNGCGKSTLLKMILNQVEPESGKIYRSPDVRINYLSQEPHINPHLTLEAEMRSVFTRLNHLAEEEAKLVEALSHEHHSEAESLAIATRLGDVQQEMEELGVGNVDARIGRILKGLGFSLSDHQRKTSEFSGGWQMRINLAKVLLDQTDVLLLDEPTNHLDMDACTWLENFLKEYLGGIIIVSHDRQFLDQVTTETAELEHGRLTLWPGNYTKYLAQKEATLEQMGSAYDNQQKALAKQTAFVERFRASATRGTQAKSREKQLDKIQRLDPPKQDRRKMAMRFPTPEPSGKEVLKLVKVSKSFENKPIFSNLNAELMRNKRVFLLGANGCGKTTLLKLIMGLEPLDTGDIQHGHQVSLGYFSQNQLETLDPNLSVFDTLQEACPKLTNTELRSILGRFLFTGEQVFKAVNVLSGGEKSKLALAKLMMSSSNTLLLDEPTNHMDIPSKEVIADALKDYEGTILCISHDRYFIQQLATEIWEIHEGHLLTYCDDYDYYCFKRDEMRSQITPVKPHIQSPKPLKEKAASKKAKKAPPPENRKHQEKELKVLEKQIITLESEIARLATHLDKPTLQANYEALQQASADIGEKQSRLIALNDRWEALTEGLE